MTKEHILAEGDLPDEVVAFGPPGEQTLVNLSERPAILRTPSLDECGRLLEEFRSIQHRWVLDCLLTPNKAGTHLAGLAGNIIAGDANRGGQTHYSPRILALTGIPESAWACLHGTPAQGFARSSLLATADLSSQRNFLSMALGGTMRSLEKALKSDHKHIFVCAVLDLALKEAEDGLDFILRVLALRTDEKSFSTKRAQDGRNRGEERKSPIPDLFALWLCRHGILLLPPAQKIVIGKKDSHGPLLVQKLIRPGLLELWKRAATGQPKSRAGLDRGEEFDRTFHIFAASSTIGEQDTFPSEAFGALKQFLDGRGGTGAGKNPSQTIHLIHEKLRPQGQPPLSKIRKRPSGDVMTRNGEIVAPKFAWTTMDSESPEAAGLLPDTLTRPFDGRSNSAVSLTAHHLTRILEKSDVSRVNALIDLYQRYLAWLAGYSSVKNSLAGTLMTLKRQDVNDGLSLNESPCFRAWLFRKTTPYLANRTMAALGKAFETYEMNLAELDVRARRANPFDMRVDAFRITSRTKTHRAAMPRPLINALAELNRRDNYALSRAEGNHHHNVFDPEKKAYRSVWFPGVAVMLEMLLTLPLRSIQARFLDSGERDGVVPDFTGDEPVLVANPAGEQHRREGLLYLFKDIADNAAVGIHVNTNKTAVDRNGSYEIPWCPDELLNSIRRVLDWQKTYNSPGKPVPCMEMSDFNALRNPETRALAKRTIPLFRNPSDPKGWPITRNQLAAYWTTLLAAHEDEMAAKGKNIVLTRNKEWADGRGSRRTALHDIHSLRVSSITGLIEQGADPGIVQKVAGHHSLLMTLYYHNPGVKSLHTALSEGMAKLNKSVDDPDAPESDYLDIRCRLFNTNDSNRESLEMLDFRRGNGDGAVRVMPHGICPGADCSTGSHENTALRAGACPLCRHRLTGPDFLAGLVLNANRLMHQMRSIGREISSLNEGIRGIEDSGGNAAAELAAVELAYREAECVSSEWAAEVQYAKKAEKAMADADGTDGNMTLLCGTIPEISVRLEQGSDFALLQSLSEGAVLVPGFRPTVALEEHREFLNEVLCAAGDEPFLLRLRGETRDRAAALLGRAIASHIPLESLESLRKGETALLDFPVARSFIQAIRHSALEGGPLELKPTLPGFSG